MKVFISWSGVRSHHVAKSLHWWLPHVLQAVRPFISSQDIKKGTRGGTVITEQLEQTNFGIICVTPENEVNPWVQFEAGALSKLTNAYVCTYLLEISPGDVRPPLGQFQHTIGNKEDTLAMVRTMNAELGEKGLDVSRLETTFELWWPKLEERLTKEMPPRPGEEPVPDKRSEESKLDELLRIVRQTHGTSGIEFRHSAPVEIDESQTACAVFRGTHAAVRELAMAVNAGNQIFAANKEKSEWAVYLSKDEFLEFPPGKLDKMAHANECQLVRLTVRGTPF